MQDHFRLKGAESVCVMRSCKVRSLCGFVSPVVPPVSAQLRKPCWDQREPPDQVVALVPSGSMASDFCFHRRAPEKELHASRLHPLHVPPEQAPLLHPSSPKTLPLFTFHHFAGWKADSGSSLQLRRLKSCVLLLLFF